MKYGMIVWLVAEVGRRKMETYTLEPVMSFAETFAAYKLLNHSFMHAVLAGMTNYILNVNWQCFV